MNFYEIEPSYAIGELGAGSVFFSLLLGMISKEIDITINEKDKYQVHYIQSRINENAELLDTSRVKAIDGSKTKTNLSENTYDRIIIRNAFHHFSKENKMLASIKEALKPDGKLCLYEPIREKGSSCPLVLNRETLMTTITNAGFKLIKEAEEEGEYGVLCIWYILLGIKI